MTKYHFCGIFYFMSERIYDAAMFEEWRIHRQETFPYFRRVYAEVNHLFNDATAILDVAGGDGHTLEVLSPENARKVTVLDADAQALGRLHGTYPDTPSIHSDIREIPAPDASFDAVISIAGIDSMAFDEAMAAEIERVMRPGGLLVFFRDIPLDFNELEDMAFSGTAKGNEKVLLLPIINAETGAIDQFVALPKDIITRLMLEGNPIVKRAIEAINETSKSENPRLFRTARYAGILTRQVAQVLGGIEKVPVTKPYSPAFEQSTRSLFASTGLEVVSRAIEVDETTQEEIKIDGVRIKELFVDELANVQYKKATGESESSTRVRGRTQLYIARKPL